MRGDVILVEDYHRAAAQIIVQNIIGEIESHKRRFIISIAGESGSGKSETAKALQEAFATKAIEAVILGQDDYFVLPPLSNDAKRRSDSQWLGPHVEIKMDLLEQNVIDAIKGNESITKPLVDYHKDAILEESRDLRGVKVLIVEGTYTSLLRNVDKRIFIDRTREDTLAHRAKRNRGQEVGDPFVENILEIEHKIIAGHKQLANIIITRTYEVIFTDTLI
ncbi:MAG TPA: zeta toxin family protein [Brevefilum sp.]